MGFSVEKLAVHESKIHVYELAKCVVFSCSYVNGPTKRRETQCIMHKAKWTPRQISLLPLVSQPRSIIRQLRDFRSCLMIDLGHETDGNNEICLGVHFALCIIKSSTTRSY